MSTARVTAFECAPGGRREARTRFVKIPEWRLLQRSQKIPRCTTEIPEVFAVNGSTLKKQMNPLSEHAVRWQLAPVVKCLGNIALSLQLVL